MTQIVSFERTTGQGARHCTQLLAVDGLWYAVSLWPTSAYLRRENGYEVYAIDLGEGWEDTASLVRAYHRSNSGNVETVPGATVGAGGMDVPLAGS